jgi:hypothetical protein
MPDPGGPPSFDGVRPLGDSSTARQLRLGPDPEPPGLRFEAIMERLAQERLAELRAVQARRRERDRLIAA